MSITGQTRQFEHCSGVRRCTNGELIHSTLGRPRGRSQRWTECAHPRRRSYALGPPGSPAVDFTALSMSAIHVTLRKTPRPGQAVGSLGLSSAAANSASDSRRVTLQEVGRLVCYSVSFVNGDTQSLLGQIAGSLASLRRFNRSVAVVVFCYGDAPPRLARLCAEYDGLLQLQGDYARRLYDLSPRGWSILASYPVLHKFLNHAWLAATSARQVLYCDCDTVFRADVAPLFDAYPEPDIVAREEVHSSRSPHGPNPGFLDEPALNLVAASLGVTAVPPFNSGVVLMNHRIWEQLATLDSWFIQCAWQLILGMSVHPDRTMSSEFGTVEGFAEARRLASPEQLARALPFPSTNQWILEEVATWLALGALPALQTADFSPADVAQNGEFTATPPADASWTVCHYYSGNSDTIAAWLEGTIASR